MLPREVEGDAIKLIWSVRLGLVFLRSAFRFGVLRPEQPALSSVGESPGSRWPLTVPKIIRLRATVVLFAASDDCEI